MALLTKRHSRASLWQDRRAVTALEYGLIACFVVAVIISAVRYMGRSVSSEYQAVQSVYPTN